jgi:hypothetical protein
MRKYNRALKMDRPKSTKECRKVDTKNLPVTHPCKRGHDWRYLIKDNYGCCHNCGDEVLS